MTHHLLSLLAGVFLIAFVVFAVLLHWLLPPATSSRRPTRPRASRSLSVLVTPALSRIDGPALVNGLLLVWVVVVALVAAWGVAVYLGPIVRRRWPRVLDWIGSWLPLPCAHRDRVGNSLMYRDRRDVDGQSVPHWICFHCGHAEPILTRTVDERDAIAQIRPAHESMLASRTAPPAPAQVINGDFVKRGQAR